jgi:hypothetical protein
LIRRNLSQKQDLTKILAIYSSFKLKVGAFVAGIILMIIGVLVYFSMQTSMSDCGSFIGQLGRTFSDDIAQKCQMTSMMQIGAGIFVVIGLSLLIYGAVANGESKPRQFECKLCSSESDSLDGLRYHVEQYLRYKLFKFLSTIQIRTGI